MNAGDKDKFFIQSISEEIKNIEDFIKNKTVDTFLNNKQLQYSIYKAFENIGEAAKNTTEKNQYLTKY